MAEETGLKMSLSAVMRVKQNGKCSRGRGVLRDLGERRRLKKQRLDILHSIPLCLPGPNTGEKTFSPISKGEAPTERVRLLEITFSPSTRHARSLVFTPVPWLTVNPSPAAVTSHT